MWEEPICKDRRGSAIRVAIKGIIEMDKGLEARAAGRKTKTSVEA